MIGILGKGQLGDMLADAAHRLQVPCSFYTDFSDEAEGLADWVAGCSVITFESENVPLVIAAPIAAAGLLRPSLKALQISSHRIAEKTCFQALGIPTVNFAVVRCAADLALAIAQLGFPLILKTTTLGYDGKGQRWLRDPEELRSDPVDFSKEWIAEQVIDFVEEVSLIAARRAQGEIVYYPLVQNQHQAGILRQSRVSLESQSKNQALTLAARAAMDKLLQHFDYVGVLTIEFFVTKTGELLANECAPRVHNSGHWTIEGAKTSQFENHLRAILNLPLGDTALTHNAVGMINIIGTFPDKTQAPAGPYHWHDYGKAPRANRKLGHVTITGSELLSLEQDLQRLQAWIDRV